MRKKRDAGIVLIAVFKLVKAATLIAAGAGALHLLDHGFAARVESWLATVPLAPGRRLLSLLGHTSSRKLEEIGILLFAYAALFLVEGCGLLARKRWAEWLTVFATASLIPFEIWECSHGVSAIKIVAIVINVAVVVYLIVRLKRR